MNMRSLLYVRTRREFLTASGTIGLGLLGTTWISGRHGLVWAQRPDALPGFDPEQDDLRGKFKECARLAVPSVNAILEGHAKLSDYDALANTYEHCLLELDKFGFDEAGAGYIAKHKELPSSDQRRVSEWYEGVTAAGVKISREQWKNDIVEKSWNRKYLDELLPHLRQDPAQFHREVAIAIRSAGKDALGLQAENDGLVLAKYRAAAFAGNFSERTCTYLDWGEAYLGVVALPIGATPVGIGLGVFVIGLWAIAKIGGC
jgi:hypothetical protein